MGLFDKKYCDICGEKIGMLGNRKLEDGNLCKNCAKKLSPWFESRRHSTVEDVKKQLEYREANKEEVKRFRITRDLGMNSYHVYIDDNQGKFAIARSFSPDENPDIVELSQVTSCRLDIRRDEHEIRYRDEEGNMKSYYPPRYRYSYNYWMLVAVNSPWFDDMDFELNNVSVDDTDRGRMLDYERLGSEIAAALSNQGGYGQPGFGGAPGYGQQPMQGGPGYGQQPMYGGPGYGQQPAYGNARPV